MSESGFLPTIRGLFNREEFHHEGSKDTKRRTIFTAKARRTLRTDGFNREETKNTKNACGLSDGLRTATLDAQMRGDRPEVAPGETSYSVLTSEGAKVVRNDYSAEAWQGPPEGALGWWKSHTPTAEAKPKKPHWAPNDVMLQLFDELAESPDRADMRYVLVLLLLRRRVLRLEETEHEQLSPTTADEADRETLLVYCPRRQAEYRVPVAMPDRAEPTKFRMS